MSDKHGFLDFALEESPKYMPMQDENAFEKCVHARRMFTPTTIMEAWCRRRACGLCTRPLILDRSSRSFRVWLREEHHQLPLCAVPVQY